jgi:hypothetical protein
MRLLPLASEGNLLGFVLAKGEEVSFGVCLDRLIEFTGSMLLSVCFSDNLSFSSLGRSLANEGNRISRPIDGPIDMLPTRS